VHGVLDGRYVEFVGHFEYREFKRVHTGCVVSVALRILSAGTKYGPCDLELSLRADFMDGSATNGSDTTV